MNTDFKANSPTIVLTFSSLLLLSIGGPLLWVGTNSVHLPSVQMWAYPTMYLGSGIFALGYVLFVLTLVSAFATFIVRARHSSR